MNNRYGTRGLVLALGLCLCAGAAICPAWAEERITSDVRILPKGKLTNKEKRAVSLAAGRILMHVQQARVAIRHKDERTALGHVEKALILAKIIENAIPAYQVSSSIKSGDLLYTSNQQVQQLIVPIYAELDETASVAFPLKRAKRESALQSSESGSPVGDSQLQYTSILLDVGEAKHALQEALEALKRDEVQPADRALFSIQEDVSVEFDELDVPLVKARAHLQDAARRVALREYAEAREALRKAASAVETYTAQTSEGVAGRTGSLADEITNLAAKLDERKEKAADTIDAFWERLVNLM
jgi:hypothetical protein